MPGIELIREGERIMTICNACRYCEGFCAVFPAMEKRLTFAEADMNYLANLCHNCSECLHACQYAPPHAFGVNVPRTLAQIRVRSYERYCWPQPFGAAFRRNGVGAGLGLAAGFSGTLFAASAFLARGPVVETAGPADFYSVVPHGVMVAGFGSVFLYVVVALAIGVWRYVRDTRTLPVELTSPATAVGLRDVLTLTYLHGSGQDCTVAEEERRPWRRWFHHLTFYGFMLCFASTTVAAAYHSLFGWRAPYAYLSLPVVLGAVGGAGLLAGPIGLWAIRVSRDPMSAAPESRGFDVAFILLLILTSVTGLLLMALRAGRAMPALLFLHFGCVLALFATLPYGKFVHGLYRAVALIQYARESRVVPTVGGGA